MNVKITSVAPEEFENCARVVRDGFLAVAKEFGFTAENNPTNGAFLQADRLWQEYEAGIQMFGLYEGGILVGFAQLEQKDADVFYLEKLSVLPEKRHRGYGSRLIDHARNVVKHASGKVISIAIIYENTRLLAWYERCGFTQASLKKFPHQSFTVCFMELIVSYPPHHISA